MSEKTPLMNQYLRVKKEHTDAILLFRLGDFYEMFYDDAKVASEILGIALTSRDRRKENPVPLCGVPHHSAETHISKLLASGKKVAVCEQTGDPKQAKGIVERKVVRNRFCSDINPNSPASIKSPWRRSRYGAYIRSAGPGPSEFCARISTHLTAPQST